MNRQISTETRAVLARFSKSVTYHIDIVVLNEFYHLPTWLCVPVISRHVDNLVATFRILGLRDWSTSFNTKFFKPESILYSFFAVLERFLKHGPTNGGKPPDDEPQDIILQNLTLNFVDSEDNHYDPFREEIMSGRISFHNWIEARNNHCVPIDGPKHPWLINSFCRPEWLADLLIWHILALLEMSMARSEGTTLYEHIGMIHFRLNGELYLSFNLAKAFSVLSKYGYYDSHDRCFPETIQYRREWRDLILKKRRKAGLPVLPENPAPWNPDSYYDYNERLAEMTDQFWRFGNIRPNGLSTWLPWFNQNI